MEYLADYEYVVNGIVKKCKSICFSEIFYRNNNTDKLPIESLKIKMYRKSYTDQHKLEFDKDEIKYVFERLSHIINPPTISDNLLEEDPGLTLDFVFNKNTDAYVKVVCTISRYFYERQKNRNKTYAGMMKDSIECSKLNPDVPFIEILQFMHFDVDSGGGHSLVNVCDDCCLQMITSDETFRKNMFDKNVLNVYSTSSGSTSSVFNNGNLVKITNTNEEYLKTINEITRI